MRGHQALLGLSPTSSLGPQITWRLGDALFGILAQFPAGHTSFVPNLGTVI